MILGNATRVFVYQAPVDMRRQIDGLSLLAQGISAEVLSGAAFVFFNRPRDKVKILWWDGSGLCLFSKRLDDRGFPWPLDNGADSTVTLSPAQLSMLLEGIDWRAPERRWQPAVAG